MCNRLPAGTQRFGNDPRGGALAAASCDHDDGAGVPDGLQVAGKQLQHQLTGKAACVIAQDAFRQKNAFANESSEKSFQNIRLFILWFTARLYIQMTVTTIP